ncbi:MAG: hypothetical protein ACKV2U_32780 [Bryobacteraceae bacterium]
MGILIAVDSTANIDRLDELTREELVGLVRRQIQLIEQLRRQIEELQRGSRRRASPFSRNQPNPNPKRPGREPGQGTFTNRSAPLEQPTDIQVRVATPERCPHCGGGGDLDRIETATVTDIPPWPRRFSARLFGAGTMS